VPGSPLYNLPLISDPSDKLIEVHLAALKWNMQQRRFGLTAEGLDKLQAMSVELLELLKANMPHKTGEKSGWNFEKAHSILHKAREIIKFGWIENFSTQGPEHCHIVFLKKLAGCTNNKDVFLTIIKWHVREGHIQYLRNLQADLEDAEGDEEDDTDLRPFMADKDDAISCELGIRYPTLQAILSGDKNRQTIQAGSI
jgi:hypothetical protein